MLSKKDFIKVAGILNKEIQLLRKAKDKNINILQDENILKGRLLTLNLITEDLSRYFKTENPNFKEDVFKNAVFKE